MKRAVPMAPLLVVIFLCLAVLSCEQGTTGTLWVSFTVQPVGGFGVNTVSCTFEGTATHPEGDGFAFEKPIVLTSEWHSPHGIYNTETTTWTFGGQKQTKTTSKSAPSGMYLDKPFWCELTWKDNDGTHKMVSDTAYCS